MGRKEYQFFYQSGTVDWPFQYFMKQWAKLSKIKSELTACNKIKDNQKKLKTEITKSIEEKYKKCHQKINIGIVEWRKFTLISTVNHWGNLNNGHYTGHVGNNFSPAQYHCNDAAVISCPKEVLENNTSYILFYKAV